MTLAGYMRLTQMSGARVGYTLDGSLGTIRAETAMRCARITWDDKTVTVLRKPVDMAIDYEYFERVDDDSLTCGETVEGGTLYPFLEWMLSESARVPATSEERSQLVNKWIEHLRHGRERGTAES